MNSTQTTNEHAAPTATGAMVDLKLEVVVIPVADVDRTKRFYEAWGGGWTPISPTATAGAWCS
jgi:hypothetical protein